MDTRGRRSICRQDQRQPSLMPELVHRFLSTLIPGSLTVDLVCPAVNRNEQRIIQQKPVSNFGCKSYFAGNTMLYVFLVDTGIMMTFDMSLALESVAQLKVAIAKKCRIPEEKQVLLISGGYSLDPLARVCSYSAGTDTNPIFLFSKSTIESAIPPSPVGDYEIDSGLKDQVEGALDMPPIYTTVVARAQLAQQIYDHAKEQLKSCERLVHEQHLQQQGWAAVVANLEDITSAFKTRADLFEQNFLSYLKSREDSIKQLENFGRDLSLLAKIPVLPALNTEGIPEGSKGDLENASSLLQWISSKDNQSSLEQVGERCNRGLEQFDTRTFEALKVEIQAALEAVDNTHMKEVKGLEDRLYGLESLMHEAKLIVQEQADQAQAFVQNQNRAGNLGDPSVLPDLCASHRKQLVVMLKKHKQLCDIRVRCARAKDELATNLHARLRWIMYVERTMCDIDNKLIIYHENLKRLKCHLEVVQQIHMAPKIYMAAVVEVVRRRAFSRAFLQWANNLAQQSQELHNKEVSLRKAFYNQLSSHFLLTLFSGMEDHPPPFATEIPQPFDISLPSIQPIDISRLQMAVPELAPLLEIPDIDVMPQMEQEPFRIASSAPASIGQCLWGSSDNTPQTLVKSLSHKGHEKTQVSLGAGLDSFSSAIQEDICRTLAREGNQFHGVKEEESELDTDVKELESETETEEFEKFEGVELKRLPELEECKSKEAEDVNRSHLKQAKVDKATSMTDDVLLLRQLSSEQADENLQTVSEKRLEGRLPIGPSDGEIPPTTNTTERILSPDSCILASQDFVTAEFYIDESMPSSYTESNGTTGTRGGQPIKSHHVIVAELQRHLEEKNAALASLQEELQKYQNQIAQMSNQLQTSQMLICEILSKLRQDVQTVRAEVLIYQEVFLQHFSQCSLGILDKFASVHQRLKQEQELVAQEAVANIQNEHLKVVRQLQNQLDEESQKRNESCQKLCDCLEELQLVNSQLEAIKADYEKQMNDLHTQLDLEKKEVIQKMTLEHELELDNLKEENKKELECKELDLRDLREAKMELTERIQLLTKEAAALEETLIRKFQEEKESLLKIMEGEYKKREEEALESALNDLKSSHAEEIERIKSYQEELESVALKEMKTKILQEIEESRANDLETEREKFAKEKELSLLELQQKMDVKYQDLAEQSKNDLEFMRQNLLQDKEKALTDLRVKLLEDFKLHEDKLVNQLSQLKIIADNEKEEALNQLRACFSSDLETKEKEMNERLSNLHEELAKEKDNAIEELEKQWTQKLELQLTAYQDKLERQRRELQQEKESAIAVLEDKLNEHYKAEIDSLQNQLHLPNTPVDNLVTDNVRGLIETGGLISITKHQEIVAQVRAEEYHRASQEASEKFNQEREDERESLEMEKQELSALKTSILAEKQVSFNEAVNKVMIEKDKIIEELRTNQSELLTQQETDSALLQKLISENTSLLDKEKQLQKFEEKEKQARENVERLQSELAELKEKIALVQKQNELSTSFAAFSEPAGGLTASVVTVGSHDKVTELQNILRSKEDDLVKLQNRLMELSVSSSSSSIIHQDKVSVVSCNVGDIVLLCYEERHENYLVFLISPVYHFLHTDCLEILDLRPTPGEPRKPWALAEITDKEYCLAKKAQNRYRVAVGTKFYRVKAKPWDKEAALRRELTAKKSSAASTGSTQ